MLNKRLAQYVKDTLLQGYRLDDIKLKLKETGYSERDIKKAIDAAQGMFEK